MSRLITRLHSYVRDARIVRRGAKGTAQDATGGTHKSYPRMARIELPDPMPSETSLDDALSRRTSFNNAASNSAFNEQSLGSLFGHALRARNNHPHRNYPSGGALFPVETYILGSGIAGHAPSVFHYHPTAHALEHLWELPEQFAMSKLIRSSVTPLSNTLIIFTAVWDRSAKKYGDFAYSHALLEAGHMAQNVLLVATALGIQSRPVAGCEDSLITDLLDLDTEAEQHIYAILISPPRT